MAACLGPGKPTNLLAATCRRPLRIQQEGLKRKALQVHDDKDDGGPGAAAARGPGRSARGGTSLGLVSASQRVGVA